MQRQVGLRHHLVRSVEESGFDGLGAGVGSEDGGETGSICIGGGSKS